MMRVQDVNHLGGETLPTLFSSGQYFRYAVKYKYIPAIVYNFFCCITDSWRTQHVAKGIPILVHYCCIVD